MVFNGRQKTCWHAVGTGCAREDLYVLRQKMDQIKENGTNFVPKPIGTAPTSTAPKAPSHGPSPYGSGPRSKTWQIQKYLNIFVRELLGLSPQEDAVIEALRAFQMPKTAAKIAKKASVNRKMTNRILKAFEKRKIAVRLIEAGRRDRWAYNKKISRL